MKLKAVNQATIIIAILALLLVALFLLPQSPFSIATGGDCPDEPLLDNQGREITSYNALRNFMNTDLSDEELQELGVYSVDGVLYSPVDMCGVDLR